MRASSVWLRWIGPALLATALLLAATPGFCGYVVRLWFENLTKGTSNAGALICDVGDQIAIKYFFYADDPTGNTEKWGTFQATIILDGKSIMTDEQANTWATQVNSVLTPPTHFPIRTFWQPDYGDMYDNAVDPSDDTYPKVATKGLYALIGVSGSREASWNFNRTLFTFTVAQGSEGQELHWAFENRITGTGLSTRIFDYQGASVLVTDNYIHVSGPNIGQWMWNPRNKHKYLVPAMQATWPEMQRIARSLGGSLVTINDEEEADWLVSTFGTSFGFLIGLRDVKAPSGKWRWESGEAVGYLDWADGQPGSGEVAIIGPGQGGKWETKPITHVAFGIIERAPADLQRFEVPADGTPVSTHPLREGTRYVIEASGQWGGKHQGRRTDAEFYRDSFGQWHATAPGDGLDLLVNGQNVDWMGTTDGVFYHPHTFSPDHVYRYEMLGDGHPVTLAIDNGSSTASLGGLQVRVFAMEPVGAYQGDSPWPTLHADSASTHNSPWAIAPQTQSDQWSVGGIGEPLAINAKGDIYCGWGSTLQRVSSSGQSLGSISLPGQWLTAVAIGVDGTLYALTDEALTSLTEDLQVLWSLAQGGHGNLVLDRFGALYHTGISGDNRVFSVWLDGTPRWEQTLDVPVNGAGLSVGADDKVYVTAEAGTGQCRVYRLTLDGAVEGFATVPGYYASVPVLSPNGRMYVTTTTGLYAFGPVGEPLWNYPIPAWANGKPTLLANGRIGVVGGWSPGVRVNMYQFDPDGTLLWKLPETIQYVWSAGSDALGGMWNVGWNQDLWLGDFLGAKAWSRSFGPVYSMGGPILGANGTLYQHVNDTLYAIGPGQRVKQETMLLLDDAYTEQGGSVTLRARLALGRTCLGISGCTISFVVDGSWVGDAQTDALGYASLPYPVGGGAETGRHEITATWAGDTQYWENEASGALWVDVPASAIQGQVFLELWQPPTDGFPITYQVMDGGGAVVSEGWALLGANGAYRIEVQHVGTASLRVKASHWLSQKVDGLSLHPSSPAYASYLLKNGDVDGNNEVGLQDMNQVLLRFNKMETSEADLNGSGKVDLEDLTIVMINFHKSGT
ncbi:MAG: hypothetical protein HRF45_05315 [Fimbriimonadia bacterium]|jgi:hypothetical protein